MVDVSGCGLWYKIEPVKPLSPTARYSDKRGAPNSELQCVARLLVTLDFSKEPSFRSLQPFQDPESGDRRGNLHPHLTISYSRLATRFSIQDQGIERCVWCVCVGSPLPRMFQ